MSSSMIRKACSALMPVIPRLFCSLSGGTSFFCYVTAPAACPNATYSDAFRGAAWVPCVPETASAGGSDGGASGGVLAFLTNPSRAGSLCCLAASHRCTQLARKLMASPLALIGAIAWPEPKLWRHLQAPAPTPRPTALTPAPSRLLLGSAALTSLCGAATAGAPAGAAAAPPPAATPARLGQVGVQRPL